MTTLDIINERKGQHRKMIAENELVIKKAKAKIKSLDRDIKSLQEYNNELRAILAELEILEAHVRTRI